MQMIKSKINFNYVLGFSIFSAIIFAIILRFFPSSQASSINNKKVIKFGVISRYNPYIMYLGYQPIMDYLTQNTPYRFELKLSKSYEQAVEFLKEGVVDIASLDSVTYLEAHKEFGAIPVVRPLNSRGRPYHHSIIITRIDSPIRSLKDLKGHSFAFASIHSASGNLIPRYYLAQNGIHLDDFSDYVNLKHHDSVAKAVLKGQYDAGAVKDIIAYKYQKKGLRFLYISPPIPSVPFTVRPDAPKELIEWVKKALTSLDRNDPEDKKIMEGWDAEFRNGFVEAYDSDFVGIRKMLNDIPKGCGIECHPKKYF